MHSLYSAVVNPEILPEYLTLNLSIYLTLLPNNTRSSCLTLNNFLSIYMLLLTSSMAPSLCFYNAKYWTILPFKIYICSQYLLKFTHMFIILFAHHSFLQLPSEIIFFVLKFIFCKCFYLLVVNFLQCLSHSWKMVSLHMQVLSWQFSSNKMVHCLLAFIATLEKWTISPTVIPLKVISLSFSSYFLKQLLLRYN